MKSKFRGFTLIELLVVVGIIGLLLGILLPNLGRARESANRAACAANLKGIVGGFATYAADNSDVFPVTMNTNATFTFSASSQFTNTAGSSTTDATSALSIMYTTNGGANGSALGSFWISVLRGSASPKLFICKSDSQSQAATSSVDANGKYYTNFPATTLSATAGLTTAGLSYSISIPWFTGTSGAASATVGGWWRNPLMSDLPVASDMAPASGTGTPAKTPAGASTISPRLLNSANHASDGQNVAFADSHVEFTRTPYCGQSVFTGNTTNDNIFSAGTMASGQTANTTAAAIIMPQNSSSPFDVVMVPVRDLSQGGF